MSERWNLIGPCLVLALFPTGALLAQSDDGKEPYQYDPGNAEEIMELCAGCHGEFGQGGGGGEYPRLAGLPSEYLAKQMRAFKSGERESIVMTIYSNDREMPEEDLLDITTFLAAIDLPASMPDIDPDLDSYQKLLIAKKVFNVPRLEGDTAQGEELYARQCRQCHGAAGGGGRTAPQLAGQYSDYLRLQIAEFRSGHRQNKPMEKFIASLTEEDVENIIAYLSIVDD